MSEQTHQGTNLHRKRRRLQAVACVSVALIGWSALLPEAASAGRGKVAGEVGDGVHAMIQTRNTAKRFVPSCRRYTVRASAGTLSVQVNPRNHYLQWGIYMRDPVNRFGAWVVLVFVNGHQVDKKVQIYEPHGSLPPSHARRGGMFNISAIMANWTGTYVSVPNLCHIP